MREYSGLGQLCIYALGTSTTFYMSQVSIAAISIATCLEWPYERYEQEKTDGSYSKFGNNVATSIAISFASLKVPVTLMSGVKFSR